MILWYLCFFVIFFAFLYHFLTKKFLNPYKLVMIFGKKGSGKTSNLTKLALKYLKSGWTVFCTEHIPGTYYLPYEYIGRYWFPEHSLLLVDEVGMIWDNRDFKNFRSDVRDWFKFQRHNKVKVYLFSQSFDIDKKLRDLTDEMYLQINLFRVFSYGKKIDKHFVLTEATSDNQSKIAENLSFEPFLLFWCGTRTLTFLPKYSKYFDSFTRLSLPDLDVSRLDFFDFPSKK